MNVSALAPADREALRHIGQMLHDCAAPGVQRVTWFLTVRWRVKELVTSLRSDCSADDVDAIAQRLVAAADHRESAEQLAEFALTEIVVQGLTWSWEAC